jgi:hypothetical protein
VQHGWLWLRLKQFPLNACPALGGLINKQNQQTKKEIRK